MTQLKYYWIVTYLDGTTYPQFNDDGTENMWGDVEQEKVRNVAWCQFTVKLSRKIKIPTRWTLFPKKESLDYEPGDEIFICRRNHINFSNTKGTEAQRIEYILGKNKEEIIRL